MPILLHMHVPEISNEFNNPKTVFKILTTIEQTHDVDGITIENDLHIWNLVRIFLYFYALRYPSNETVTTKQRYLNTFIDSIKLFRLPVKKKSLWIFSTTRNLINFDSCKYDKFADPLVESIVDKSYVMEWPNMFGKRDKSLRCKDNHIYFNLSLYDPSFWKIMISRFSKIFKVHIENEKCLVDAVSLFSRSIGIQKKALLNRVYQQISLFKYALEYFGRLVNKYKPKALLFIGAYSGYHMAAIQAAKRREIPTIEMQHGFLYDNHPGYVRKTPSENRDCVPDYFLAFGRVFKNTVEKGNLFKPENIVSVGYPFLDIIKVKPAKINKEVESFISKHEYIILVTSQWSIGKKMENFFSRVAPIIKKENIGIIYKPHPNDWRQYEDIQKYRNVLYIDKNESIYELFKVVNIHSTAYSTTGIEALYFGVPNIAIDFKFNREILRKINLLDNTSTFLVSTPEEYVLVLDKIIGSLNSFRKHALIKSEDFFEPHPRDRIKTFLSTMGI